MNQFLKSGPLALAILLVSACAGVEERHNGAQYSDYVDDPISDFRFVSLLEWRPVDEKKVLLRFDRNRYYVLTLREPCIAHVREADRLVLDPVISKRLRVNDRVRLDGTRCIIDEIRPLDFDAWAAAGAGGGSARPVGQSAGGT